MKVKELIDILQREDPEKLVLISAYEQDYDELLQVRNIKVKHEPSDRYWKGNYTDYPVEECNIEAILLPR